jgi:cell division protein FtsL
VKGGNLLPFALAVAVFVSAIFVVQVKNHSRTLTSQLNQMRVEQQNLDVTWSQLQLERAALSQHARVDQLARRQFGMIDPPQSQSAEPRR